MPGSVGHLIKRFFAVIRARSLGDGELDQVREWLSPAEFELFDAQPAADQRHGLEAGLYVQAEGGSPVLTAAAALHDVGKRHSHLGPLGRSVATILIILGVASLWDRAAAYRDHGRVAASELEKTGSKPLVVAFARHHHDARPADIDPESWAVLIAADERVKASRNRRPQIT